MYPFSYTGLRLVHHEKVRDAMERARVDAELARNTLQRTARLSPFSRVLMCIRSRLNVSACHQKKHSPIEIMRNLFP